MVCSPVGRWSMCWRWDVTRGCFRLLVVSCSWRLMRIGMLARAPRAAGPTCSRARMHSPASQTAMSHHGDGWREGKVVGCTRDGRKRGGNRKAGIWRGWARQKLWGLGQHRATITLSNFSGTTNTMLHESECTFLVKVRTRYHMWPRQLFSVQQISQNTLKPWRHVSSVGSHLR